MRFFNDLNQKGIDEITRNKTVLHKLGKYKYWGDEFEGIFMYECEKKYWNPRKTKLLFVNTIKRKYPEIDFIHLEILNNFPKKLSIQLANVAYALYKLTKNKKYKKKMLEYSAMIGHPSANYHLALESFEAKEYEDTKRYLLRSCIQDHKKATQLLYIIYLGYYNVGIPKDVRLAKTVCKISANLGNMCAEHDYYIISYMKGLFGRKENLEIMIKNAKELYEKNYETKKFLKKLYKMQTTKIVKKYNVDEDFVQKIKNLVLEKKTLQTHMNVDEINGIQNTCNNILCLENVSDIDIKEDIF